MIAAYAGDDFTINCALVSDDESIVVWRSIYASYEKDVETLGIAGKRYTIPEIVFANDTVNEDNRCFQPCLRDPNRECVGGGVLDLRSCLFGNQSTSYKYFKTQFLSFNFIR